MISATAGSVPVRMQKIGVSKTLTRFQLTAVNDAEDREVANGQDPKDVEHSKGRGNDVSTHKEAIRKIPGYPVKGSIIRSSGTTAFYSISISHLGSISFAT